MMYIVKYKKYDKIYIFGNVQNSTLFKILYNIKLDTHLDLTFNLHSEIYPF